VLVVPSEILVTYFKCLAFLFCIFLPGVLDCALTQKNLKDEYNKK
jgi:hypothetical protein